MRARLERIAAAALLFAAIGPAAAIAESAAPPAVGVLVDTEQGDVSCYLQLRVAGGTVETVHADFELCPADDLIGEKVRLVYETTPVQAASCEGDPDCARTDLVPLAVSIEEVNEQ